MEEDPTDAQIIHENIKKKLIAGPPKIMEWLNDLLEMQEISADSHKKALNELKEKHEKEIGEKWQEIFEVRQENLDLRKELKETKELSVQVSNAFLNEVKCQSGAERKKRKRRKKTKGQLILKCLFGVFNFFQKKERKQVDLLYHSSRVEFVRYFFGRNIDLKK